MTFPYELLRQLEDTTLAQAILESAWLFPTIETAHVLALTLVFGSILIVDLRLLGWASRDRSVRDLAEQLLPWTWGAFTAALITGALLFASQPVKYFDNLPLRIKFLFLLLAGLNMAVFHLGSYRQVGQWGQAVVSPLAVRWAGALSLLFWVGVITAGRWIAFSGY